MVNANLKIIWGGGAFNAFGEFSTPEKVEGVLKVLDEEGVKVIDTGKVYGTSEELIGKTNAPSRFIVDTKYPGGLVPSDGSKEGVVKAGEESLKLLKTNCVSRQLMLWVDT
jgi:aryl-alcohol dehydrogenase-like predicted oxidoreductase